jgi:hypothetical protein
MVFTVQINRYSCNLYVMIDSNIIVTLMGRDQTCIWTALWEAGTGKLSSHLGTSHEVKNDV